MRVRITIVLSDWQREALNAHYGRDGKATRETANSFFESICQVALDDISQNYQDQDKREADKAARDASAADKYEFTIFKPPAQQA